jgi:hypothetical protein
MGWDGMGWDGWMGDTVISQIDLLDSANAKTSPFPCLT